MDVCFVHRLYIALITTKNCIVNQLKRVANKSGGIVVGVIADQVLRQPRDWIWLLAIALCLVLCFA